MKFNKKRFLNPPAECSPAYFWGINSMMDLCVLKKQLHAMYDSGLRAVCLHPYPAEWRPIAHPSKMSPDYLSDAYMKKILAIVKECERLGMKYILYDEGGYPSGCACGKVYAENPEKFAKSYYLEENNEVHKITLPHIPEKMSAVVDLLADGAAETFIRLTHEKYKKFLKSYFGKTIDMVFCDEPSMPCYTADLPKIFKQKKGYAIEPFIERIFVRHEKETDEKIAEVRIDYAEVMTELFRKRFLKLLQSWCRENNLQFGGHFIREDLPGGNAFDPYISGGYGNILKALSCMDIPGVDTIARQIFPGNAENGSFAKYASSVAHQSGKETAFAEIFAVYGNGLTPKQMKWIADFLMVRGINKFVPAYFMQEYYDSWLSGCRPHMGPHDPLWQYMHHFHKYLSRCCALLTQGTSANRTAFLL